MTGETAAAALERAHLLRLAGEREQALRLAGSISAARPDDPAAAQLLAQLLLDAGHAGSAGEACERLVDAWIRRGDLGAARVACELGIAAGGYAPAGLAQIAAAFGLGSRRTSEGGTRRPPALPERIEVAPFFAERTDDALLEAAERALARFVETPDPVDADRVLPHLPLFADLEQVRLTRLLSLVELRELAPGAAAISQGEEGSEAFLTVRGELQVKRGETELAVLGAGSLFGEMALVSAAPRAASVVAMGAVQLLAMSRAGLEQLAEEDPALSRELSAFCHRRMIDNLVRHSAILSRLDVAQRADVIARFEPRTFEPGEHLVRRGDGGESLFLIASGGVKVRSTDADGDRLRLAELGPGDVVGEISLVLRRPANADVVARHPTVALELGRETFHALIQEHPGLLERLYDIAIQRDELTRSVVAQPALDAAEIVLI